MGKEKMQKKKKITKKIKSNTLRLKERYQAFFEKAIQVLIWLCMIQRNELQDEFLKTSYLQTRTEE